MLLGSLAGSNLGHRIPVERSLRAFAALLIVVAVANGAAATAALIS